MIAAPGLGTTELCAGGAKLLECGSSDRVQEITITSDTSAGGASLGVSLHLNEPQPAPATIKSVRLQLDLKLQASA
jgi:hypothetical protein